MPPNTPSFAKGRIKAALKAIIDPELKPAEIDAIWHFFGSRCAYCGIILARDDNRGGGDMDHLVSVNAGGVNHISNRVLSCSQCNAHDKRERHWEDFLREQCGTNDDLYTARHTRIMEWVNRNGDFTISEPLQMALNEETTRVFLAMDSAVNRLRTLKQQQQ